MSFNPQLVDLVELVSEAKQAVEASATRKRIDVRIEIEDKMAVPLIDRARLKQVLLNYLSNAVKFTAEDGRVVVRLRAHAEQLVVEVEDNGIGISKEDLPRLFTQFQQLDGSSSKKYQGTGLGLAITRQVVEAQGGTVGVRSTPGKGSTFYACLPLVRRSEGTNGSSVQSNQSDPNKLNNTSHKRTSGRRGAQGRSVGVNK
jgi:signal transduction histidine kinase